MLNDAIKYIEAGLSIIPATLKSKQPDFDKVKRWKAYQSELPSQDIVKRWFNHCNGNDAIALICGSLSKVLIIDIDNHTGDADDVLTEFKELCQNTLPDLWEKLTIESTQSGGYHLIIKTDKMIGNVKLAQKPLPNNKRDTRIETRGEGGYALVFPSKNYVLLQGDISNIYQCDEEELDVLLSISKSFDLADEPASNSEKNAYQYDDSPGNAFNKNGDHKAILLNAGWKQGNDRGQVETWIRPGKERGLSGTFNHIPGKFHCFSSSAYPLDSGKTYSPFALKAILEHNGDFSATAKSLIEMGFGSARPKLSNTAVSEDGDLVRRFDKDDQTNHIDVVEAFLNTKGDFRYNVIKSMLEFKPNSSKMWNNLQDRFVPDFWCELKRLDYKIPQNTIENVLMSKFVKEYNPFVSYFKNLDKYDEQTDYIGDYASFVGVPEDQKDLWTVYFSKWAVATVATALERGVNHTCLVLVGAQGIGKTTFFNRLVPDELLPYYTSTQLNPADKDSKIMVTESFIINLDELESSNREEIGFLKSLITVEQTTFRKPYAKRADSYRRHASFCGSVNRAEFLTDITGSRRFLTVDSIDIDLPSIKKFDVNKLWAQALYLLNNDFVYWFSGKEIEVINEQNKIYQIISPEEELINKYFKKYPYKDKSKEEIQRDEKLQKVLILTGTEITMFLNSKSNVKVAGWKIGNTLKALGYGGSVIRYTSTTKRAYYVTPSREISDAELGNLTKNKNNESEF